MADCCKNNSLYCSHGVWIVYRGFYELHNKCSSSIWCFPAVTKATRQRLEHTNSSKFCAQVTTIHHKGMREEAQEAVGSQKRATIQMGKEGGLGEGRGSFIWRQQPSNPNPLPSLNALILVHIYSCQWYHWQKSDQYTDHNTLLMIKENNKGNNGWTLPCLKEDV